MNNKFFSFLDVAELIAKEKKYTRKEYDEHILKLLQKVKAKYIENEKKGLTAKEVEALVITDDDLVELKYFADVLDDIDRKIGDRKRTLEGFIKECYKAVHDKITNNKVESEKLRKIVE